MSRFFRGGNDSSSESSSDEEDLYESEAEEQQAKQEESEEEEEEEEEEGSDAESSDSDAGKAKGASRFLEGWSESEESDTEQTAKVKSAKDKRHDELEATITAITNAQKINDWNIISNGMSPVVRILCNHVPVCDANRPQSSTSSTAKLRSSRRPERSLSLMSSVSPSLKNT